MTWHIVCLAGPEDHFTPHVAAGDAVLTVPFDVPGHPESLQSSVPDMLTTAGLSIPDAAHDLLRAAIGVYTGDVRIDRGAAFDRWTRDLTLYLPVQSSGWAGGAPPLERLLAFLTGDRWHVETRPAPDAYRPATGRVVGHPMSIDATTIVLFSGGLDSYIGAIDALDGSDQVALVGHHAAGQGPTSRAQSRAIAALHTIYSEAQAPFLQFWVSPPKGPRRASESTTRGRSILFLALGVAVASSLSHARLVVPENGFISLNVPLTPARLGSFSTRTTHPHLVALLRDLVAELHLDSTIELPYRHKTKGEMLMECANADALSQGIPATMSCAHSSAGRFGAARDPNLHCGYCVPCVIRRAAIAHWGADPTPYAYPDLRAPLTPGRGADLRAFRLALDRYAARAPRIADVLVPGPLPGNRAERDAYLAVFRRGLAEVRAFLDSAA
ncbi:MAG: Qat anti-phage system QueC-like protein QatC [Thermomicrobiales bacterium]